MMGPVHRRIHLACGEYLMNIRKSTPAGADFPLGSEPWVSYLAQ